MINFDDYVHGIAFNENKTKHNKNWPYILDHPYRIFIIGVFNKFIIKCNRKSTRH